MSAPSPDAHRRAAAADTSRRPRAPRRRASLSPNQRAWARFRRNRLGYRVALVFAALLVVGTFAELISNDRPLVARYDGECSSRSFDNPPETRFGGDFATPTDWNDPFIARAVRQARQLARSSR